MGKTDNCIRMLQLLNSGGMYKISYIAEYLGTSPRNVIELKKELDQLGYYIDTTTGRYGGYSLNQNCLFPSLALTKSEKDSLVKSYEFILSKQEFFDKVNYQNAMGKVFSSVKFDNPDATLIKNVYKETLNADYEEVKHNYEIIDKAVKKERVIEFNYVNNKGKVHKKTVYPYLLYMYNDSWFLLGYSKDLKDYRYFKLSKMSELVEIPKKFRRDIFFKESDFFDEMGFKKNDEWFDIKFMVSGYYLEKLKEKTFGKDQKIEFISNDKAVISCKMQYKFNIINFIMGMGSFCRVLEPEWLVNEVVKISKEMQNMYI